MNKDLPVLIDFDGIIRIGDEPADYVREFLKYLSDEEIKACIISNSTLSTSKDLERFFELHSIKLPFPIITASDATLDYVRKYYNSAAVYCKDNVKSIFSEFITNDNDPEVVVIGDMGKDWNYKILNEIFIKVKNGADLIAMQKNRFWNTPSEGYLLDVGPFVAAIEYAAGKESILIGKPSKLYFNSALDVIDAKLNEPFIMIGDDLETDIQAAQNLGGQGILVYTGKTSYPLSDEVEIEPDYEAQNLNEVIDILINLT